MYFPTAYLSYTKNESNWKQKGKLKKLVNVELPFSSHRQSYTQFGQAPNFAPDWVPMLPNNLKQELFPNFSHPLILYLIAKFSYLKI